MFHRLVSIPVLDEQLTANRKSLVVVEELRARPPPKSQKALANARQRQLDIVVS